MPASSETSSLKLQFGRIFGDAAGARVHVVRAPGRVNLIGEHTDYNDGFVLPMAIEPQVLVICRARDDGKVRLASTQFPGQIAEFSVQEKIATGEPKWANYGRGIAAQLLSVGIPLVGMDALITNTLPVGGGLSSSAALIVSIGLSMLTLAGASMESQRLALLAQKAEHEFAGVPSGIMDQTIVADGRAGHAMLLDCRDLSKQFLPIDDNEIKVVIVNSMVKHELSGGEYAKRRKQCETGVAHFKKILPNVKALRDVPLSALEAEREKLDPLIYRRCHHVITEIARTTQFANQLGKKYYDQAGELMVRSHESLRDDYEVSAPELDFLAAESMNVKGVYGARMTGGGFGGCIVAIVQPRAVDAFSKTISDAYVKKFKITPTVFATNATGGASVVE